MGKKVKSLLRVFFPNKKKKKNVVNNTNNNGGKASATTKSSNIKEERSNSTSGVVNNQQSSTQSTKLKLIVDTNSSNNPATTIIGTITSTDLTIDPTFSSSSTPSLSSPVSTTSNGEEEHKNRSRTSTSTSSGDLSFERHLAAATATNSTEENNKDVVSTGKNQEINTDDSLLSHLDEETVGKVRAFEQSAPHPYSAEEQEIKTELVSSAVFEETLTNLHRRRTSSSVSSGSNSADIDAKSFDETVESHEQFNYRLENSVTETQLEYVNGGLYVEDTEEEEVGSVVKDECFLETDNVESEEINCGVEIECKVDEKEVVDIEVVEEVKKKEIKEIEVVNYDMVEEEPSCPSPIRGGGGCCSTLPEVTTTMPSPLSDIEDRPSPKARTTAAIEEAAFETSRSSRMEGVRAALEEATRKEEDEDFNVEEEIESPPSPAVTVEELPNEQEEEKVVRSSSPAKVSPPTTTVDGGSKSSSSTEALAWTALSALMTAPAPQAIQQKKTRTPTNLWQHGELGEDQAGEIESDLDNISIACSSIACSDTGTADISLRDDNVDGYMDLVSTGVGMEVGRELEREVL